MVDSLHFTASFLLLFNNLEREEQEARRQDAKNGLMARSP
jgi:hypothetical protein